MAPNPNSIAALTAAVAAPPPVVVAVVGATTTNMAGQDNGRQVPAHLAAAPGSQAGSMPGGLSVLQLMEQMAAMKAQIDAMLQRPEAAPVKREMKTYYHQVPGSAICVTTKGPSGEHLPRTFHFYGGQLETDIPEVQDFLDGICDRQGTPVFSKPHNAPDAAMQEVKDRVIAIAAASIDKLGAEAGPRQ